MKRILILLIVAVLGINPMTSLFAQQQNFLTASGNKLYDSTGKEVRLTGVNWFGFETSLYSPHGIWVRDMKSVLQQIKDMGFNTIRVPWCNEMLNPESTVNVSSYGVDPYTGVSPMNEEEGAVTKPIELLDIFVMWCQENDMKIVLDNHSRAADGFLNEEVWYTDEYSEERWINDWIFLADRYKEYSAVVAMDLNNEPHGSTWGNSNPETDWNKAAERCGNAILEVNPNVLIMVEGVGEFEGDTWWWGGQLKGAEKYPIVLSDQSKLIYSAHEYGPEVAPQDWFEDPTFPSNMPDLWYEHYHYLYENNTSPLLIGEFGIKNQNAFGGIAYTWFTEYMDFMGDIYSWTFWTMNPNSGDTGGILQDDWKSVNQWKLDVLLPHIAPVIPNVVGGDPGNLPPVARLTASDTSGEAPLTVTFSASTSSDPDGDSLSYDWDFGDGNTATGEEVTYTFENAGDFPVVLTVDDGELTDTATVTISVTDEDDPADVTAAIDFELMSTVAPATVIFDGTASSSEDGSALSYVWNFGDDSTGIGEVVSHVYTEAGDYTATLTVSNGTESDTASVTFTILPNDTGGDCSFGAPLSTPLASINSSFEYSYTLGAGGPDLSNVTSFVINWDLQNNGLWQFSMNTNNGQPSWWNDLKNNNVTSLSFNSASPAVTLEGTGFPNLDGSYYVTMDGSNFVMVSMDAGFTLYFSNQTTQPECSEASKTSSLNAGVMAKVLSNPATSNFEIQLISAEVKDITLYSISGHKLLSVSQDEIKTRSVRFGEELSTGIYMLKVSNDTGSQTLKLVKK